MPEKEINIDVSKDLLFVSLLVRFSLSFYSYTRVQEDTDVPYEEEILRHPYQVKCWLRYVEHKQNTRSPPAAVFLVYERAVKELPGRWVEHQSNNHAYFIMCICCSYKLWYNYLKFRRHTVRTRFDKIAQNEWYYDFLHTGASQIQLMKKLTMHLREL